MDPFDLNVGSMLIVLILGHLSTGLLLLIYKAGQPRSDAVNLFLLSKLLQAAAWTLFALRAFTPSMGVKIAANAVLFAGAASELVALLILKKGYMETQKKAYVGLLAVCVAVFVLVTACDTEETARIACASLITAALMAFPAFMLYADKRASPLQKTLAGFYGVTILFVLFRAYAALRMDLDLKLSSSSVFSAGLFLLLYLIMLTGSVGFILLDKEKTDSEVLRAASFDGLTSAMNRGTFIPRAKELLSIFARKRERISFLLIDIDNFKKINDRHGHYMGDAVLVHLAETARRLLRKEDLFARYGGEEFAVLLPGIGGADAVEIAERLRQAVADGHVEADTEIRYTVSIGVATVEPDMTTDLDTLYRLSDDALYQAKTNGKNCVFHHCGGKGPPQKD